MECEGKALGGSGEEEGEIIHIVWISKTLHFGKFIKMALSKILKSFKIPLIILPNF